SARLAAYGLLACGVASALAQSPTVGALPPASEIVARNVAARGGVEAWQRLRTMAWVGHAESASSPGRDIPFLLEQKRPDRTRFEVMSDGQRSIRMFDGNQGWKVRPSPTGRPEVLAYSEDELRFARGAQVIDGPLMDYAAKGAVITVAGRIKVDNRDAYLL